MVATAFVCRHGWRLRAHLAEPRSGGFSPRRPTRCRWPQATNGLSRCLCLSTGGSRRDVTRNAALPRINALAMFEAGQTARRDFARSGQTGKAQANRCKRHADLLGDLQIEPLTVFLQALEDFDGLFPYKNRGSDGMRHDRACSGRSRFPWAGYAFSLGREPPLVAAGERDLAREMPGPAEGTCSGSNKCDQSVRSHNPKFNRRDARCATDLINRARGRRPRILRQ